MRCALLGALLLLVSFVVFSPDVAYKETLALLDSCLASTWFSCRALHARRHLGSLRLVLSPFAVG